MINKIVELKDFKTRCRILDSIIYNGNTLYLVLDFRSKSITTISPKDVYDIVEIDPNDKNKFISVRDCIMERGI
jgi:hypothetical protein